MKEQDDNNQLTFNIQSKDEIIRLIENLTQEPGYIYSLSIILSQDLFLIAGEVSDIDWQERLSFQELSFLIGFLVKNKIEFNWIPSEEVAKSQVERTYNYFKALHHAHFVPFSKKILAEIEKPQSDNFREAFQEFFSNGEFMQEPIFYGGSGAYDFQYLESAPLKYKYDEKWILENKGITIQRMSEIAWKLKKLHEEKWRKIDIKDFENICKNVFNIFCFTIDELKEFNPIEVKKFVDIFLTIPGKVNEKFNSIGDYNSLDSHPIISLNNDLFYIPISFLLAQSIYESPFYWMASDEVYKTKAFKNRGNSTEEIAFDLLKNVFGEENVYKNVKIKKNKKKTITDIDVLAIAGNKAVIIQAKSKKLTELSKKGDDNQLKKDFQEAIQKAYDQGITCRNAILNKSNKLFLDDDSELELGEFINDAYIICVTSDHYPAIINQVDAYLKKEKDDPYPMALNIFDLDIILFYLKDPFEFLYYVRQRLNLSTYFRAASEITYLAFHIKKKLFIYKEFDGGMIEESFAQLIDANFPVLRGDIPRTEDVEKLYSTWKNTKFDLLILQVKNSNEPGFTDAIYFLYDLAGAGADDLIEFIDKTKNKTLRDNKQHDFSMSFDEGNSGINFISFPSEEKYVHEKLLALAKAKKYSTKAKLWIGMASIKGSNLYIDSMVFNFESWVEDEELDKLTKVALKKGIELNLNNQKYSKNQVCYCGSGKKYKRCHGKLNINI